MPPFADDSCIEDTHDVLDESIFSCFLAFRYHEHKELAVIDRPDRPVKLPTILVIVLSALSVIFPLPATVRLPHEKAISHAIVGLPTNAELNITGSWPSGIRLVHFETSDQLPAPVVCHVCVAAGVKISDPPPMIVFPPLSLLPPVTVDRSRFAPPFEKIISWKLTYFRSNVAPARSSLAANPFEFGQI